MKRPKNNKMIKPKENKLMGAPEVGQYLGWGRDHVRIYYKRSEAGTLRHHFPTPVEFVGNRPLWRYSQIRAYAEQNEERIKADALYWDDKL